MSERLKRLNNRTALVADCADQGNVAAAVEFLKTSRERLDCEIAILDELVTLEACST